MLDDRKRKQVQDLLAEPSYFPDRFKSWIPKVVERSVGIRFSKDQLPLQDTLHLVDTAGGTTGEPQFQNGWVNFAGGNRTACFWKDTWGTVHLAGVVKTGAIGTAIFTLPGDYRPEMTELFVVISNGAIGYVTINPTGSVVATAGSNLWLSLSGISFRAY